MVDIMGMMKKAQEMQAKLADAQDELSRLEVEGQSGGGLVKIALTGKGEMKSIHLDPSLLTPDDREMAEDLDSGRVRRRQRQGRSRGGGEDAGIDGRPAAAAGHEAAVLTTCRPRSRDRKSSG